MPKTLEAVIVRACPMPYDAAQPCAVGRLRAAGGRQAIIELQEDPACLD